jgi:rubrerythrin
MPDFLNPFSGVVLKKLNKEELIRALRLDLAGELEAIHAYTAHADATEDSLAKKVLLSIADEERVHCGELIELIKKITGDEAEFLDKGASEVISKENEVTAEGMR